MPDMINLKLVLDKSPLNEDDQILFDNIMEFNAKNIGEKPKHFSVFLRDDENRVFGGISVYMHSNAIYVDLLWVEDNFKGLGYGKQLLDMAEKEAVKNNCIFSIVDTMDFQAENFYRKNGYKTIGKIDGYLLGHDRIFMKKKLSR